MSANVPIGREKAALCCEPENGHSEDSARDGGLRGPEKPKIYRCGTLTYTSRGLVALFAWLLWGDICFTLMEAVVPSVLPLKLRSLDSPNVLIGFILGTLPGIFNFTITPWLSFKSDRYRSRWGRRLPFILSTMPFLTLTLILIGFSSDIGAWVHARFLAGSSIDQAMVVLVLLAVFAAAFDLFNMFVNTVYWYLFNDIVPEEWMGRFMGWFRLVSTVTAAAYNFLIFRYAESHMQEIFLGAALLYFVGFGIMCLRIKEGEYPPPPEDEKRATLWEQMDTFARECFTSRYYWDIFLNAAFAAMAGCIGVFHVFFLRSLGLSLDQIGKMAALTMIVMPICYLFSGILVDKWHPVRTAAYLGSFEAVMSLTNWVWIFIPSPFAVLYFWIAVAYGALFRPLYASVNDTANMARFMRLFPREYYGQFSGAMAMVRAAALILGAVCAGLFIDLWRTYYPDGDFVYRFNVLWQAPLTMIAFYFHYRAYRVWKRLGADHGYHAPLEPVRLSQLPRRPDADSKVRWWLVGVTAVLMAGQILGNLAWVGYYSFFEQNTYYVTIFSVAIVLNIALYAGYLAFVKFMERP